MLDFERGLCRGVVAGNKPKVLKRLIAHFHEGARVGREGKPRKRWLCKFHGLIVRQTYETRKPLILAGSPVVSKLTHCETRRGSHGGAILFNVVWHPVLVVHVDRRVSVTSHQ